MKLHLDRPSGTNRITAYGPGFVVVNEERIEGAVIVSPERLIREWPPRCFEELDASSMEHVVGLAPAIALLGTGATHRFPPTEVLASLMERRIGVEVMSTAAACHTYNILMAEDRAVAAMLLPIEA